MLSHFIVAIMSANILSIVALLAIANVFEEVRSSGLGRLCLLLGPCGPDAKEEVIPSSSKSSPSVHRKSISGRSISFVYPCCRAYPPGQQIKFYCDPSYCLIPITLPLLPQPPASTDCCIDCPAPMSPGTQCCSTLLCLIKFPVILFQIPTTEPPPPPPYVDPCCHANPPNQQIKFSCDPFCPNPSPLPPLPQDIKIPNEECCQDCPPTMEPGTQCCSIYYCLVELPQRLIPTLAPTPPPPPKVAPNLENYDSEVIKKCRPHCDNHCGFTKINRQNVFWDQCEHCFRCRRGRLDSELDWHAMTAVSCKAMCINDGHNGICGVLVADKDNLEGTWCEDCWRCRLKEEIWYERYWND